MGIGCLLPLVARNDDERRIVINSVSAHWEGNKVLVDPRWWGIICRLAQSVCSGVFRLLCGDDPGAVLTVLPPLAFDYRGKIADARWRKMWDAGWSSAVWCAGSLGIAFGDLLLGVPFALTPQLRVEYLGSFWQLLTPFPYCADCSALGW